MLISSDYIWKIKLKADTERTVYLHEIHKCTCCLNISTDHQRNGLWHSRVSSVHYWVSKFSPDSEMINYVSGPGNLSAVAVSLFRTHKPFQKQLPLTPERISIATLHDTVTPCCLPNVWSLTVTRPAGFTLDLPCVVKRTRKSRKRQPHSSSWILTRKDVLQPAWAQFWQCWNQFASLISHI